MKKQKTILFAIAFGLTAGTAHATPTMNVEGKTTQPIGHYEFCQQKPSECRADADFSSKRVTLTQSVWRDIVTVNSAVNTQIRPLTDQQMWGREEVWSYPTQQGDCEDYVLLKRKLLIRAGIPEGSLLITVVRQPDGSGHAVLTVTTDRGDFILDNLNAKVRLWSDTEYRYLKRQSNKNPGQWVSINDNRRITLASAN